MQHLLVRYFVVSNDIAIGTVVRAWGQDIIIQVPLFNAILYTSVILSIHLVLHSNNGNNHSISLLLPGVYGSACSNLLRADVFFRSLLFIILVQTLHILR